MLNTPTRLAIDGGTPIRGPERPLPPVFPRYIPPSAYDNVRAVLDSGFTYDINATFEVALAEAFGVEHAVTLSNCTAAATFGSSVRIAPPWSDDRCFSASNERQPMSPIEPAIRPLYAPSGAWQQSSTSVTPRDVHRSTIGPRSQISP